MPESSGNRPAAARLLVWSALFALGLACASAAPRELRIRGEMARGSYREAAEAAASGGDELLRHLDRALALFYAGDALASNLYFARAEHLSDERYTRSLSTAALSLLVNDTVLPYQPDAYERLLVPLYRALNYVSVGQPADAAVEARRLSSLLLERRDREPERAAREGDAFLSHLAGGLLDWAGRPEEARVAYRIAAEAYGGGLAWPADPAGEPPRFEGSARSLPEGELVLLVEVGFVAAPTEERIFLFLGEKDLERGRRSPDGLGEELAKRYLERHAGAAERGDEAEEDPFYLLPLVLKARPVPAAPSPAVTLEVEGRAFDVPVGFAVSRAAALAYEEELPALLAKTAARTIAKALAFKEATDDEGVVLRVLANAFHVATEKADTRAWISLPDEIRFARVRLPAGRHDLRLRIGAGPGARLLVLSAVEVFPGRPTIVTARAY
jgi:hypothetical protein